MASTDISVDHCISWRILSSRSLYTAQVKDEATYSTHDPICLSMTLSAKGNGMINRRQELKLASFFVQKHSSHFRNYFLVYICCLCTEISLQFLSGISLTKYKALKKVIETPSTSLIKQYLLMLHIYKSHPVQQHLSVHGRFIQY